MRLLLYKEKADWQEHLFRIGEEKDEDSIA